MPEFPEFTQGQYGKLTAEVMNSLVAQVQQNTEFITNFGLAVPSQPRGGKGNYPMIARLGTRILPEEKEGKGDGKLRGDDEGDGDGEGDKTPRRTGYEWTEVTFNESSTTGSPWESAGRRSYSAQQNNPAFPTNGFSFEEPDPKEDPDAETTDTENFSGMVVFLFPFANNSGKSILVFQSPRLANAFVARITGNSDEICTPANKGDTYTARRLTNNGEVGDAIQVRNGCEPGGMGGKIDGAECDIDAPIVRVPNGTEVIVSKVGDEYYFNATNERCVECCSDSEEPLNVERIDTPQSVVREVRAPEYDPGFGSIHMEMMK